MKQLVNDMNTSPLEAPKKEELIKFVIYAAVGLMIAVLIFFTG